MAGRLCSLATRYFSARTRARGKSYEEKGRVKLSEVEPHCVEATVRGTRRYKVVVVYPQTGGSELYVECTCPFFHAANCCKHIWAVLITADDAGLLQPPTNVRRLNLDLDGFGNKSDEELMSSPLNFLPTTTSQQRRPDQHEPAWKIKLRKANELAPRYSAETDQAEPATSASQDVETRFELPLYELYYADAIPINTECRMRRKDGTWGKWRRFSVGTNNPGMANEDFLLATALTGVAAERTGYSYTRIPFLDHAAALRLLPQVCHTGRLYAVEEETECGPLEWDDGPPWNLMLELRTKGKGHQLRGLLVRDKEQRPLDSPLVLMASGWIIWPDRIARLANPSHFGWISLFRKEEVLDISRKELPDFLASLAELQALPKLVLPDELQFDHVACTPTPVFHILDTTDVRSTFLSSRLSFDYDGHEAAPENTSDIYDVDQCKVIQRDLEFERRAAALLRTLGAKPTKLGRLTTNCEIAKSRLPKLVAHLMEANWRVLARNKPYRAAGTMQIHVKSGIDWFDLHAQCEFDGVQASLPSILKALKKKDDWVQLKDGSFGMLPRDWLERYGSIAALAEEEGDSFRFKQSQAGLLDAWLATQPEVAVDAVFARAQKELSHFKSVKAVRAARSFQGTLRPYQTEGLGWFLFLEKFGFGGCLADDMGLGKTVQVLALLERRRVARLRSKRAETRVTSLVVAPRSVVFNWVREAEHFTPELRVLEHAGTGRAKSARSFKKYDVILTTYGTLRRDIGFIKGFHFDYAILDESQSVKNASAQVSKAARLLQADHRLALSGTPIENHLGELWSLFDFLNPGLLGNLKGFNKQWAKNPEPKQHQILARTVRPFILRRTKAQVATDLPQRQEETLYCDLPGKQRTFYKTLLNHVRQSVLSGVKERGLERSKIHVLEGLLRLRQAACHPGLIDEDSLELPSAKFEALLPQLSEVIEEGHKALVFSQFTSFLALLRKELDTRGVNYAYLDGRTRKRQERVDRFQHDKECPLFLISLKAGGLGLNLTAAEYVFLLDPWWNPAVEAQAIDRAHRIGQRNEVFAYRLIARDTIEEKVVKLQENKRALSDAIIGKDNALIRNLTKEDLEYLFE